MISKISDPIISLISKTRIRQFPKFKTYKYKITLKALGAMKTKFEAYFIIFSRLFLIFTGKINLLFLSNLRISIEWMNWGQQGSNTYCFLQGWQSVVSALAFHSPFCPRCFPCHCQILHCHREEPNFFSNKSFEFILDVSSSSELSFEPSSLLLPLTLETLTEVCPIPLFGKIYNRQDE